MKKIISLLQGAFTKAFAIPLLLLLLSGHPTTAQLLSAENRERLETVAQYVVADQDNTLLYLERLGYLQPNYIQQLEWEAMPSLRKMEMAWRAAEFNAQGKQFIEAMAVEISKDYHSIKSERNLDGYFTSTEVKKVQFKNPPVLSDFKTLPVPKPIKSQLLTIGKYVNEGALGSLQNVFSVYMNLSESQIYDILASSPNNKLAFEQGLIRSSVPPPHAEKIKRMANDLQVNFEAARNDQGLSRITNRKPNSSYSFVDDHLSDLPSSAGGGSGGGGGGGSLGNKSSSDEMKHKFKRDYDRYSDYKKTNYSAKGSRKFGNMKRNIGGFGGVIFGDVVKSQTSPVLRQLSWRPIGSSMKDHMKIGYLDFFFSDGTTRVYGPVLHEDVFAADAIVNDSSYAQEEGLGMVSIHDPFVTSSGDNRFSVTLHPVLSHLRLGWAMASVDAFPSARTSFSEISSTPADRIFIDNFYKEKATTWKITDKPTVITYGKSSVVLNNIALSMFRFSPKEVFADGKYMTKIDEKTSVYFNKLLPLICSKVKEYERVNNFAKVLLLFRWARSQSVKAQYIDSYRSFVKSPKNIVVTEDGRLSFYSITEDKKAFEEQGKNVLTLVRMMGGFSPDIDSIITACKDVLKNREMVWNNIISGSTTFNKDESSFLIEKIPSNYIENKLGKYDEYTNRFNSKKEEMLELSLLHDEKVEEHNSILKKVNGEYMNPSERFRSGLKMDNLKEELKLIKNKYEAAGTTLVLLQDQMANYLEQNSHIAALEEFRKLMKVEKKLILDLANEN